jgi:uncharacterized membrane protein YadS
MLAETSLGALSRGGKSTAGTPIFGYAWRDNGWGSGMDEADHRSNTTGWRSLWRSEDYWAIWLGFALILAGLALFLPRPPAGLDDVLAESNTILEREAGRAPFRTLAWYDAHDAKRKPAAKDEPYAKALRQWLNRPQGWKDNPLEAFVLGEDRAAAKQARAQAALDQARALTLELRGRAEVAQAAAAEAAFGDAALNAAAEEAINAWRAQMREEEAAVKKAKVKPFNQIGYLLGLGAGFALLFGLAVQAMHGEGRSFLLGFPLVWLLAVLAYAIAAQSEVKALGLEYALWAILLGLLISNTLGTPKWAMPAVQVELFIKTGLVLLGCEILFGKILAIGLPGIFVAWVVTPIVLVTTYWFGQRVLRMESRTLNITISADMSVCGVSAAIATAAACRAKKEELTLAVGISMVFTSIMMIVMPYVILALDMDHVLGGAWIGGTVDSTGAVAAAAAFLSDKALYVAATIKMIQNILIGVIAFAVAVYWVTRVERGRGGPPPSAMEIWHRFPKFVLGFVAASLLFSGLAQAMGSDRAAAMLDEGVIGGWTELLRGWCFCLAFVSIGLATNFRSLAHYFKGGKPVILYVCGQALNLALTLAMAWLMFFVVFPNAAAGL